MFMFYKIKQWWMTIRHCAYKKKEILFHFWTLLTDFRFVPIAISCLRSSNAGSAKLVRRNSHYISYGSTQYGFFLLLSIALIKSIIPFRSFSDNNNNICYHRSTTKHKYSQYYENKFSYVLSVGWRRVVE